jgi:hypothetical protein
MTTTSTPDLESPNQISSRRLNFLARTSLSINPIGAISVFLLIPASAFFVYLFLPKFTDWHQNTARAVYVTFATALPLFLFYLHAVTRRDSAFHAFATALNRLGLLDRLLIKNGQTEETESKARMRIRGYADRFSAAFGTPANKIADRLLNKRVGETTALQVDETLQGSTFELRTLLAPIILSLLIFLEWIETLPPIHPGETPAIGKWLVPDQVTPSGAAFLGAYFFCIEMLRRRFVHRDLNTNVYMSITVRLIVVLFLSTIIQLLWKPGNSLLILSFLIGIIPVMILDILFLYVRKLEIFTRIFTISPSQMPLRNIEGIDIWHEARLEEEDIQDIENLACANLVILIVNTRYSADRLVDWVDQAILYTAMGPEEARKNRANLRSKLRSCGVRTATDLVDVLESGPPGNLPDGTRPFLECLNASEASRILTLATALTNHPNFPLVRTWRIKIPAKRKKLRAGT